MLRGSADATHSIRFMAPMRVHCWRSKLPMNRMRKSLKINRGAFCRFKGAMRVFVRGILTPALSSKERENRPLFF